MTLDHDEATRLFDHLSAGVPPSSPSVAELVALGERGRRRRTTRVVLAAVAAVLVVVGGGVVVHVVAGRGSGDGPVSPSGSTRLVGAGRVVVAVPSSYRVVACAGGAQGSILFGIGAGCAPGVGPGGPVVFVESPLPTSGGRPTHPAPSLSGVAVLETDLTCGDGFCSQEVVVPSQHVGLTMSAPGADARLIVSGLRASLQILPADKVAVPLIEQAYGINAVDLTLAQAGLKPVNQLTEAGGPYATDPAVGSVVSVGDGVAVTTPTAGSSGRTLTYPVPGPFYVVGTWMLPDTGERLTFSHPNNSGSIQYRLEGGSCPRTGGAHVSIGGAFAGFVNLGHGPGCAPVQPIVDGRFLRVSQAGQLVVLDAQRTVVATYDPVLP